MSWRECEQVRISHVYFSSEEALESEKNSQLWKSIFNYDMDKLDYTGGERGVSRYKSTKQFLMDYLNEEEILV